jgi:gibberellin 2-oxidase
MVLLSKPTTEQFTYVRNNNMSTTFSSSIPLVDLSKPDAKNLIVKACEDFGFFKVINHGIPMEAISQLESEAFKFFSLPLTEKEKAGPANPFGYGNKKIGLNGDVGWVEYLLLTTNQEHNFKLYGRDIDKFR